MSDLIRFLTLQDATTRTVLLGTGLLGLAAGVVGCFAVLRRRALVADAVAHAALPGIAAAFMLIGDRHFAAFLLGAAVFGLAAAALISLVRAATRIKEDAAIGIAIGAFFGLGVVWSRLIQNSPTGNRAGLDSFIFGRAASMLRADTHLVAAAAVAALIIIAVLYKELKLVTFDPAFSASMGRPTVALDLLILAMVAAVTVVGLPAVGLIMVVALLIIPAVAARVWTDRLGPLLVIAGAIGLVSALLGTALSATLPAPPGTLARGWPTGPLIVLVAGSICLFSLLLAPRRGVLAEFIRHRRTAADLRRRARLHLPPPPDTA